MNKDSKIYVAGTDGTPRKLLDVSKATGLACPELVEGEDGIRLAYKDFLENPMRAER